MAYSAKQETILKEIADKEDKDRQVKVIVDIADAEIASATKTITDKRDVDVKAIRDA